MGRGITRVDYHVDLQQQVVSYEHDMILYVIKVGTIIKDGFTLHIVKEIQKDGESVRFISDEGRAIKLNSIIDKGYIISNEKYSDCVEIADAVLAGTITVDELAGKQTSHSHEIMVTKSKEYYEVLSQTTSELHAKTKIVEHIVKTKIELLTSNLRGVVSKLNDTAKELKKIVHTLTIYAGINEDVIHVVQGNFANSKEPIHMIQNMRFMDEEVGDPTNGGITYDSVDKFYEWLNYHNDYLGYKNFKTVLPYQKCVTIMRVRREKLKTQTHDPFGNIFQDNEDMKTCLLVRNGENVCAIHSDMHFSEKLFPDTDELSDLMQIIQTGKWSNFKTPEEAERILGSYRNGMVLIQGLFDRTDLLAPLGTINIFKGEDLNNGKIVFEYNKILIENDDFNKKVFDVYINFDEIEVGDRIMIAKLAPYGNDTNTDRFNSYNVSDNWVPYPIYGEIYTVEEKDDRWLSILYLPDDKVFDKNGYYVKRKRKKRFRIYGHDDLVINIDKFTHRDLILVNNLMYRRRNRSEYLWMVPLIGNLKDYINNTVATERPFAQLIQKECPHTGIEEIMDEIHWWKVKNKWKRSLQTDDAKALRMIVKKIKHATGITQ